MNSYIFRCQAVCPIHVLPLWVIHRNMAEKSKSLIITVFPLPCISLYSMQETLHCFCERDKKCFRLFKQILRKDLPAWIRQNYTSELLVPDLQKNSRGSIPKYVILSTLLMTSALEVTSALIQLPFSLLEKTESWLSLNSRMLHIKMPGPFRIPAIFPFRLQFQYNIFPKPDCISLYRF